MLRISLSEAYVRRETIAQAGQHIFFQGEAEEELYKLNFIDVPQRRVGWFLVSLRRDDEHSTSFSLPGQVIVIVK